MPPEKMMMKHECNKCSQPTLHDAKFMRNKVDMVDGLDHHENVYMLTCKGCEEITLFIEKSIPGKNFTAIDYIPPRIWFKEPDWVKELITLDNSLYGILAEVYSAANENQIRLLAMGVRAALDHTMTYIVQDIGGFEQKLEEMVKQGHISKTQEEMLLTVIDAASAAAHRGYRPPRDLLGQMISVMEGIIRNHYVTGPMLKTIKSIIPPRPPRVQKPKANLNAPSMQAKDKAKA